MSANANLAAGVNPLDRNHDGSVNAKDLLPNAGNQGLNSGLNANSGLGLNSGLAGGVHQNPLDRNHDGRVNAQDLLPGAGNQGLGLNSGLGAGGLGAGGLGAGAHHNPLDRNYDGRVNAQDLLPGAGNQGLGLNSGLGAGAHHNPLDRNYDGRVNAQDLLPGAGINSGLNSGVVGLPAGNRTSLRAEPTIMETIQKDIVVHERIHPVQKEEIQPIIYREREQLDVKQVTQMMHETHIQPTLVQQRELPAQTREAIVERGAPIQENVHFATREVDATTRSQVVHAPIVNEIIKKTIIEEIQPVLERDIIQSTVIQNTQPIYEKIVEAPTVYRETIVHSQNRAIVGGSLEALQAQGFNLGGYSTGINSGIAGGVHHNPLDRNYDGRVNAQDLLPGAGNQGLNSGLAGGVHHNPLDRNYDGRVNAQDLLPGAGNQGLGLNSGLGAGAHHNPLDRNYDGRVNAQDLLPGAGVNSGLQGSTGLVNEPIGNRRRSLVEALPASYSYLNSGAGAGLSTDAKIMEAELANQNLNSSVAAKPVL